MLTVDVLDLYFGLFTDEAIIIPPNLRPFIGKETCKVEL